MEKMNMENPTSNEIKLHDITDLYLAAFLMAHHLQVIKTSKKENGTTVFYFEEVPELQDLILAYVNNGYVRCKDYKNCMFEARTLTKGQKQIL